jgi:hypothetical protein
MTMLLLLLASGILLIAIFGWLVGRISDQVNDYLRWR